ncbi:MAG: ABC transporter ATP-binding protein [Nakamurella sp.]
MNGAEAVGLSALLFVGYLLVTADAVTVGAVTAAALLFHRLFTPLGILLVSFDDVQRAGAALARMVGVTTLDRPVPGTDRPPAGPVSITAKALRHSYDGAHPVLLDVDVEVPAGTSLAVVGASGAGKSTLAALLGGALPATTGTAALRTTPAPSTSARWLQACSATGSASSPRRRTCSPGPCATT